MQLSMKKLIKKIIYGMTLGRLIRRGHGEGVYITYDDGPHPVNTLIILDILDKYKAKATFFMVGEEMMKYPDIVQEVIKRKHTIGYHSYKHDNMKRISRREIVTDIAKSKEIMERFNYKISYYRPPYGDLTLFV